MISRTTNVFWKLHARLPESVQRQAKSAYERFETDPFHPGLQFKQVHDTKPVFSARISRDYRAVGVRTANTDENEMLWFWIGSHSDYDNLLARM